MLCMSGNVVFDDEHSCKRAIAGSGAPVPPEVGPDGQTSISGLPSQDYGKCSMRLPTFGRTHSSIIVYFTL